MALLCRAVGWFLVSDVLRLRRLPQCALRCRLTALLCAALVVCVGVLQIWSQAHPELLPRVELVAGDMFDAATPPSPPAGSSTAYVLRNILHDW